MNWKKLLCLSLFLSLSLSLAACGDRADESPSPSDGEESPGVSQDVGSPSGSPALEDVAAYTQAVAQVDPDTVMFTVNGREVTAEEYFYWLSYNCYYYESMMQSFGMELDLDEDLGEDGTVGDFLKGESRDMAAFYMVLMEQKAEEMGFGLTEEQRAEWEQSKTEYRQEWGEEEFALYLRQLGLSEAVFDRVGQSNYLYENLCEMLVPMPTREELDQYIQDNEICRAKHILIRTVTENEDGTLSFFRGGSPTNEDGTDYTGTADEYNAAAKAKAEDILAQIGSAGDVQTKFDELMFANSEDTGLATSPDGYTFGPGEMVEQFETGTKELEYGQISGLVESDFGYHIILRLEPDVTDDWRGDQVQDLVGPETESWVTEMEVVTAPAYDALDVKAFYDAYRTYQQSLVPEETGDADGPDAPEPTGTPAG